MVHGVKLSKSDSRLLVKTQKSQAKEIRLSQKPTVSNPRKCSSFSLAASDRSIPNGRLFPQTESEGGRERNERARETALNIDGAPQYRSIRQPSSHNYTSASSRVIHHIDTHDYMLVALRQKL